MKWTLAIHDLIGDRICLRRENQPEKSGEYLCTCIKALSTNFATGDRTYYRYLRVMTYNAEKNHWHDVGNQNGISHTILAWSDEGVCESEDFILHYGSVMEKEKEE